MKTTFLNALGRRPVAMMTGLTLAACVAGGSVQALIASDDDKKAEEKAEKHTVKVIRAGDPVTIERGDGKIIIRSDADVTLDSDFTLGNEAYEQALKTVEESLKTVTERLEKATRKEERTALEAARQGLETALETLKADGHLMPLGPSGFHTMYLDDDALQMHLKELEIHEGELNGLRFRIQGDLDAAREELAEALEGIDVELDMDGDMKNIRIRSLHDAEKSLAHAEERELEALKRAEERLKERRVRIEERIKEREAKEAERKADRKDG